MNRYIGALLLIGLLNGFTAAQKYVDTMYTISSTFDISFGKAPDFAGNQRNLKLDISVPTNDTPPSCGRPLLIVVHGGAFVAGDKSEGSIKRFRQDFAKRGYTTAAVNYRLGQFPTEKQIHCNISGSGNNWDCLNMADSSEWYRAYYRAVQDVNGALRYLIKNASTYNIDPSNVFICGESAGGFIAMGVGFIDDTGEVLTNLVDTMPNVKTPNAIYESPCIVAYGLDTSIASMDLVRGNLGHYSGSLNQTSTGSYTIRGVGNFFGASFNNIFGTQASSSPALYLYHQPNDLVVPYTKNKVFAGYNACVTGFPFNCQNIINRPDVYGSRAIKTLIDSLVAKGNTAPDYKADFTTNTANCAAQIANASLAGHATDNFWLRTGNMASFFATKMDSCSLNSVESMRLASTVGVQPNPVSTLGALEVRGNLHSKDVILLWDLKGQLISQLTVLQATNKVSLDLSPYSVTPGVYLLQVSASGFATTQKIVVVE